MQWHVVYGIFIALGMHSSNWIEILDQKSRTYQSWLRMKAEQNKAINPNYKIVAMPGI